MMNVETIKAILTVAGRLDGATDAISDEKRKIRAEKYREWNTKRENRTKHLNIDFAKNPTGFSETSVDKVASGADCSEDKIFPYYYGMELKWMPLELPEQFQETLTTSFDAEDVDNRETSTELESYLYDAELVRMNDWRIKNGFQPLTLEDNS
jgi:hypothetical protein